MSPRTDDGRRGGQASVKRDDERAKGSLGDDKKLAEGSWYAGGKPICLRGKVGGEMEGIIKDECKHLQLVV
jgi:hypothetical protein